MTDFLTENNGVAWFEEGLALFILQNEENTKHIENTLEILREIFGE